MLDLRDTPPTPTLATLRLTLRRLGLDDAPAVADGAGDQRVAQYLIAVPSPYPLALARRWVSGRIGWWGEGRGVTLAIARREDPGELIGTASLRRSTYNRRAELGYWLSAGAWGCGYATEAAQAMLELGFGRLGLARIYAQVIAGNDASCRVLEKLGMRCEGVKRSHVRKGNKLCDVMMFARLASDP